jgi:hypothetical protein
MTKLDVRAEAISDQWSYQASFRPPPCQPSQS